MEIIIEKAARSLRALDEMGNALFSCPVALGKCPEGPKEREGDGRTPEGEYFVCLKKEGKYGPSLGLSYPNGQDALRAGISGAAVERIREAERKKERPPWGTPLGGEIYIHGGGTNSDWTAGCVALEDRDARMLYDMTPLQTPVRILP